MAVPRSRAMTGPRDPPQSPWACCAPSPSRQLPGGVRGVSPRRLSAPAGPVATSTLFVIDASPKRRTASPIDILRLIYRRVARPLRQQESRAAGGSCPRGPGHRPPMVARSRRRRNRAPTSLPGRARRTQPPHPGAQTPPRQPARHASKDGLRAADHGSVDRPLQPPLRGAAHCRGIASARGGVGAGGFAMLVPRQIDHFKRQYNRIASCEGGGGANRRGRCSLREGGDAKLRETMRPQDLLARNRRRRSWSLIAPSPGHERAASLHGGRTALRAHRGDPDYTQFPVAAARCK